MRLLPFATLRILDLDIECLPGHWIAADYVSKIITAAAWKWVGERGRPHVLTHYDASPEDIAEALAQRVQEADMVVGHYIRGFDLPLLNGNLLRAGLEPLEPILSQDTKKDLLVTHGRSLSQKNLAAMVGVGAPKIDVTLYEWEAFNTKTPGFRKKGVERVVGDVEQNIEMRAKLIDLGWLGPPKVWTGQPSGGGRYLG